jgi:hypothetical protein
VKPAVQYYKRLRAASQNQRPERLSDWIQTGNFGKLTELARGSSMQDRISRTDRSPSFPDYGKSPLPTGDYAFRGPTRGCPRNRNCCSPSRLYRSSRCQAREIFSARWFERAGGREDRGALRSVNLGVLRSQHWHSIRSSLFQHRYSFRLYRWC